MASPIVPNPEANHPDISAREARVDLEALRALGYVLDTEVARIFGWSTRMLMENRRKPDRIAFTRFGQLCLYKITDVQAYLEAHKVGPTMQKLTLADLTLANLTKNAGRTRKPRRGGKQ
jgi:hypothetical protein